MIDTFSPKAGLLRPIYRNYVLAIVAFGQGLNYLDRQIITVLLPSIKREMNVSDTQLALMSGLSFALFYGVLGVPLARVADRWSRRNLMAISIGIWSVMSALGGLAQNLSQLILARFGVGVGEAGYAPASFSLLSDYFPKERRHSAVAIVNVGPVLGMGAGLLIGGLIVPVWGWRAALLVAGLPGLAFAIIFALTVKEPPRGLADGVVVEKRAPPPFIPSVLMLWRIRSYRLVVLTCAAFAFTNFAIQVWMPSFLERTHALSMSTIGPALAAATAFSVLGTLAGGVFGDRLFKIDERLSLLMPMLGAIAAWPLVAGALVVGSPIACLLLYAAALASNNLMIGSVFALAQGTAPLRLRALGISFVGLLASFIGFGLGPVAAGVLSDFLVATRGGDALRTSMLIIATTYLIPVLLAFAAMRTVKADIANSAEWDLAHSSNEE